MATAVTQPVAVPVGVFKQFGPYGPAYEVLGLAAPENGEQMVNIVILHSGETLTYQLDAVLEDPEAQ